MQLWQYTVCLIVLCIVLLLWVRERRARKRFAGVFCYPLVPFIGNIHQVGDSGMLFNHIEYLSEVSDNNEWQGRVVVWLGPCPVFITHNTEDIRIITNTFLEKPYFYGFAKIWLGNGLVTAPGSTWKHSIKKLSGTFSSSVVDGYLDVFNTQAKKLVEHLQTEEGKEPFDIVHKYLAFTTFETICQTALGLTKLSESIVTTEYYDAFNRCLELLINRGVNVLVHPEFIYKTTSSYQEMKKTVSVMQNVSDAVIKERTRDHEKQKDSIREENADNESGVPKFKSFLDILLDLKDVDPSLTEQQIRSEIDTIILGGQESAATVMLYTFLSIGCKPKIQEKLYAEIKNIFGDSNRPVTKEDLSQMKYVEAVINETLRMFPPFPVVMRYADTDLKIGNSLTIPKGTVCGLNLWGSGRSVRVWGKDTGCYRPERWLETQNLGNSGSFLAFSCGRRACIGRKYAIMILKTMIAHCVRDLEFISEADKLELKYEVVLRPRSGHLLQVRRRNRLQN